MTVVSYLRTPHQPPVSLSEITGHSNTTLSPFNNNQCFIKQKQESWKKAPIYTTAFLNIYYDTSCGVDDTLSFSYRYNKGKRLRSIEIYHPLERWKYCGKNNRWWTSKYFHGWRHMRTLVLCEGHQSLHRGKIFALALVVHDVRHLRRGDLLPPWPFMNTYHCESDWPSGVPDGRA